jgi:plastocyanin
MTRFRAFVILLLIAGTFALMAGCTSQPAVPSLPKMTITAPANGASLPAGEVTVKIQVQNFTIVDKQGQANVAGQGHVHYYMDVSPIPSDPTKPAIPADANAAWAHVAATSYTFTNVTPGSHTFTVQLANNDHTPVVPLATASVTVTVAATQETPTVAITSPANGATLSGSSIPVTIQVQNFNIVEKQGQASVPGEGHVHYYLDVSPLPSDPTKPAIPADANAAWAHVAATSYTFTNVSPGMHTVSVQLAKNDHTPVIPLATSSVMVTVAGMQTTTPTATMTTPQPGGQTVQVSLAAQNIAFDKSTITVPAGAKVVMTFNNMDSGIPHNFALYTDSTAKTKIFAGDFVTGPKTVTYTFTAPSQPGTYFFRCDVHPTAMTGSFIVT